MLLLLSRRSSLVFVSHISGVVELHYCAGKVCLAELLCMRAHDAITAVILEVVGRNIINGRRLLRWSVSMILTSRILSVSRPYWVQ